MAIVLRSAAAEDQAAIVSLVRAAQINPMDLKWRHFVVAVDEASGSIVSIGQIKPHGDGSRELASIATVPAYQHQGIARRVIEHLLARNPGELYLTCLATMEGFYAPFGFRAVGQREMSPYFRRLTRVAGALMFLDKHRHLVVMRRSG